MKMADRKPQPSRFGTESQEARLARLRDQAPVLEKGNRLRVYALMGSALMLLTLAAFYFAMEIYKAAAEQREEASLIEVEQAPEIKLSPLQQALERIEAEQENAETLYQEELEALQSVDLLSEMESAEVITTPARGTTEMPAPSLLPIQ